jgi:DNA-binding XRE family transcriptional regulator
MTKQVRPSIAIGQAIKTERELLGVRQATLARRASLPRDAMCRIEKGEYRPSLEQVEIIAYVLGVTIDRLRGNTPVLRAVG